MRVVEAAARRTAVAATAPRTNVPIVAAPAADPAANQTSEPKPINLSAPAVQNAIAQGKALIAEGKSKADAARAIFAVIKDESKDVIVAAFVEGATLTPKGALTYWYNNRRKAGKNTARARAGTDQDS